MSSQAPITEYLGLLLVVLAGEAVSEENVDRGIQLIPYTIIVKLKFKLNWCIF
jgi:hypothetical protein